MKAERTIAEAARLALQRLGKASTIAEIYQKVTELSLYEFNTPTPEHVLRTEIRRKTFGVERVDLSQDVFFKMAGDELYELMKEPSKRRAAVGVKRIQRASDKEAIINLLTSESVGAFGEIWRLLFFAAMVGYKNGRRDPLVATQTGEGIRQDSFSGLGNEAWRGTLYLFGLVETGSAELLRATEEAEDERIKIFEEYANGGLAILKEEFESSSGNLDALLTFIQSQTQPPAPKAPDLQIAI